MRDDPFALGRVRQKSAAAAGMLRMETRSTLQGHESDSHVPWLFVAYASPVFVIVNMRPTGY